MAITVRTISYGAWGKCVEISNGIVDAVATIELGPRIIRYGFTGGPNLFKEDTERSIQVPVDRYSESGDTWYIYGGHRLWTSPEGNPRSYYPDNVPVTWTATEKGVILTPPPEKWNQLQKQMELTMDESGEVTVIHRITNLGAWSAELSVWALSVMAQGGQAFVPQVKRETGLLGNRILALWPYSRMDDPRVTWGNDFIRIRQDSGPSAFKIGTNNENGWAAYLNGDCLFVKYFEHHMGGRYPDYGVSFEAYVNDHFLELESLSELTVLEPGATVTHRETWHVFRNVVLPEEEKALGVELQHFLRG
ncbi:hypothetical protein [Gorillibacterium sp. sgz5001074]|uniref:hypothetical protein n=1 Tax=Gorillibacterium sp. sgz5001074 TaxID=3446695 RepID=UPI003F663FE3